MKTRTLQRKNGTYYLVEGKKRINAARMHEQTARDLNTGRKLHGQPLWVWAGKTSPQHC